MITAKGNLSLASTLTFTGADDTLTLFGGKSIYAGTVKMLTVTGETTVTSGAGAKLTATATSKKLTADTAALTVAVGELTVEGGAAYEIASAAVTLIGSRLSLSGGSTEDTNSALTIASTVSAACPSTTMFPKKHKS